MIAIKHGNIKDELTYKIIGCMLAHAVPISKIENSVKNARFETILKVFDALSAKVNFSVELKNKKLAY